MIVVWLATLLCYNEEAMQPEQKNMSQPQVYEGTLDEITLHYGKELNGLRLKVVVEESAGATNGIAPPFYETATSEEWTHALQEWAAGHDTATVPLSDAATDRESIYEGRGE